MELRQLRVFVAIAEERHLGRAASRLYLSPQAISKTLATLEREAGGRLVERHSRGVAVTEAGMLLYERAARLVADAERTLVDLRDLTSAQPGVFRVGIFENGFAELTTPVLAAFRAVHPRVSLRVHHLNFVGHLDALLNGDVDVVLARPPLFDDRFVLSPVFVEPQVAMLPSSHRLVGAPALAVKDLLDETFGSHPDSRLNQWMSHWRLEPHRNGEATRISEHAPQSLVETNELVALGAFVSTTAKSNERLFPHPGVRHVPLSGAGGSTAALARLPGVSNPLVDAFIDIAQRVVADNLALVPGARLPVDSAPPDVKVGE